MSDQHIGVGPGRGARNRVREFRKALGMTQVQLAAKAGVWQTGIGRIERGLNRPRKALAITIAYALRRPLADVFPGYLYEIEHATKSNQPLSARVRERKRRRGLASARRVPYAQAEISYGLIEDIERRGRRKRPEEND